MAEIHVFPTRVEADQASRLTADLMAAHEAGRDLGSRVPHIHAASASLQHMADQLRRALADLQQTLESLGLHDDNDARVLNQLVREIEALADVAKRIPTSP